MLRSRANRSPLCGRDDLPAIPAWHRSRHPPGTARPLRWASASPTGRCAARAARHSRPAAPASATGARRAWSARRRGFRRRSRCARSAASRAPRRWSAVDRATPAWSRGCAAAVAAWPRARSARCRRCAPAREFPARAGPELDAAPRKSPRAARRDCAGCRSTAPSTATRTPRASRPAGRPRRLRAPANRWRRETRPASCPSPVGAAISACRPLAMAGQASSCAGVAPSGNVLANHACTAG